MVIAFAAPLLLGLVPRLAFPAVVLEIVAGIIVGPDVLGLVQVDVGGLLVLADAVVLALRSAGRTMRIGDAVERLASTTAQIRVRGAFLLLVGFAAIAQEAGLEVILGAFVAGILLGVVDADGITRHPEFRVKLEAVGFGVLI